MSSIAVSYGESGPVFCGLKSDGSYLAACYGANPAIIYGTPTHLSFLGLTGGVLSLCVWVAISPGLCMFAPCSAGYYEFKPGLATCKAPNTHICLSCLNTCPKEMYFKGGCTPQHSDVHLCVYNCSSHVSSKCFSNYSSSGSSSNVEGKKHVKLWAIQVPIIVVEVVFLLSSWLW